MVVMEKAAIEPSRGRQWGRSTILACLNDELQMNSSHTGIRCSSTFVIYRIRCRSISPEWMTIHPCMTKRSKCSIFNSAVKPSYNRCRRYFDEYNVVDIKCIVEIRFLEAALDFICFSHSYK